MVHAAYQVEKDSNLRPRCITIEHRFFLFVYADRTQSPVHGLGISPRGLSPLDESIALVVAIQRTACSSPNKLERYLWRTLDL